MIAQERIEDEKSLRILLVVLEGSAEIKNIEMDGICMVMTKDVVATTEVAASMPVIIACIKTVHASVVNTGNGCVIKTARKRKVATKSQIYIHNNVPGAYNWVQLLHFIKHF